MGNLKERIWEKYIIREETVRNMGLMEDNAIEAHEDEKGLINRIRNLRLWHLCGLQRGSLGRRKGF